MTTVKIIGVEMQKKMVTKISVEFKDQCVSLKLQSKKKPLIFYGTGIYDLETVFDLFLA